MSKCNGGRPSTTSICTSLHLNMGVASHTEARGPMASGSTPNSMDNAASLDSLVDMFQQAFGYCENVDPGPMTTPFPALCGTACSACSTGRLVTHRCHDCKQVLCNKCVVPHQIIEHYIIKLSEDNSSNSGLFRAYPSPTSSPGSVHNGHSPPNYSLSPILCDKHKNEAGLYCKGCKAPTCSECTVRDHAGHPVVFIEDYTQICKEANEKFLKEVNSGIETMDKRAQDVNRMAESITLSTQAASGKIQGITHRIKVMVDIREQELLTQVNQISVLKMRSLEYQIKDLNAAKNTLRTLSLQLSRALSSNLPYDIITAYEKVSFGLRQVRAAHIPFHPVEDELIEFVQPEQSLYKSISKLGMVCSSGYAQKTVAMGRGRTRARTSRYNTLTVQVNDHLGEPSMPAMEQEPLTAQLVLPDGQPEGLTMVERLGGMYVVRYKPLFEGPHILNVKLRGRHIVDSPFMISVTKPRDYSKIGSPLLICCEEGGGDGQLCRPWGVCTDADGHIIIADRSNNRIQVFDPKGKFIFRFGKQGSEPGHFDRPAGIAADTMRRIVVADKDNHRIQVFNFPGEFLFLFGEKGNKSGQFNYPWDVDVNSEGRIVVSDTRNHRIQLFSANGNFIGKFGYENQSPMWKHFDSPRGVCFDSEGRIIVTDFNNHCLVILSAELGDPRILGSEGSGQVEFVRPQGVTTDEDGNIIVADSRNHRIQILEPNGSLVRQFGTFGSAPGELDRPSGICVSPDGKIFVVDFGNNRIQAF